MKSKTKTNDPRVENHTSLGGSLRSDTGRGSDAQNIKNSVRDFSQRKTRKRQILVGTWNVQGWKNKIMEVTQEFHKANIDILVTSEMKKKGNGCDNIDGTLLFWSGVGKDQRAKAGIGILIKKQLKNYIKSWEPINERLIKIELEMYGRDIVIIGVYGPNDDSQIQDKEKFIDCLSENIQKIKHTKEIILAGDFNSRTGRKEKDSVIGSFGEEQRNDNGERLTELCELHNLKILNGFYKHKNIHKFTWTQETRNLRSIIDYIIIKQKTTICIKDIRVKRGPECGSDHKLVVAKLEFPWNGKKSKNSKGVENSKMENVDEEQKYKLYLLQDETIRDLYKRRLDQKLTEFTYDSAEDLYDHIKQSIKQAAMEALGKIKKENKKYEYNLKESTKQEIRKKKTLYEKWLSTKNIEDYKLYKKKNVEVKKLITKEKNCHWENACAQIDQYLGGARNSESWKLIKNLQADRKEKVNITQIKPTDWENYYKNLLTESKKEFLEDEEALETQEHEEIVITQELVQKAIKTLKNNKSSGPGGINPELVKHGPEKLVRIITTLFNKIINEEEPPREWKTANMTSIFKKGNREKCENYRGIAVLPTMARLYGKILKTKLEEDIEDKIGYEQAGFTAGKSCMDHIYTLQQVIDKKRAKNRSVHLAFVDLRKAYDTIPRKRLWQAMMNLKIPKGLIKATKNLYKGNNIAIKVGKTLTTPFETSKGLLQGCGTSPTLFKIYLEDTLRIWKKKCQGMGLPIRNEHLYTLCFADDQVIIAQDEEDICYMLRKLTEAYKEAGMEINYKKTEYLETNSDLIKDLEVEDNIVIKGVTKFKYLGFTITRNADTEEEIKCRLGQTRACIRKLHPIIWNKNINKKTKHKIFNTIVRSIMTYGAETWVTNKKTKEKIRAVEMEYWRRCCEVTRTEKIRNEDIRNRMNVETDIIKYIEEKRLIWYGHTRRASASKWIGIVTDWSPMGRRKRGRPRRSWRNEVDEAMEARNLQDGEWEDRKKWRIWLKEGKR